MLVLTERHRECLLLRSRGLTNKQAASVLGCSFKTVDHYHKLMLEDEE